MIRLERKSALLMATVSGILAVIVPTLLRGETSAYPGPFGYVYHSVRNANWTILLVLLCVAGGCAALTSSTSSWLLGIATVWWLPLWSLLDAATAPIERHNLLPFEWLMYAFGVLPGAMGAICFRGLARLRKERERSG